MRSIFKREFRSFFKGMSGYYFLAAFFLIAGYFFVQNNILAGSSDIAGVFAGMSVGLGFLLPFMTMNSLIIDGGASTEYLMYASEIQIVFGKFLATLMITFIGILGMAIYQAVLSIFSFQQIHELTFQQLGLLLLSSTFVGIGLLASSLSYRRIQALFMSYTLILMFYMMDRFLGNVVTVTQFKLLRSLSFFTTYSYFELGVFSPLGILCTQVMTLLTIASAANLLRRRKQRGI